MLDRDAWFARKVEEECCISRVFHHSRHEQFCSAQKKEAVTSLETVVSYHKTTRPHSLENLDLNLHRRENIRSRITHDQLKVIH
jgi:hypothetical protein